MRYYFQENSFMARARQALAQESTRSETAREVLTGAVLRAAAILAISQGELARILGLSAASVSRMASGKYLLDPEGKEWQLGALFVRLFRSLDSITGGSEEHARRWLHSANSGLAGTPAAMLRDIDSFVRVVHYLDASRARI
jgi:hypothetical protein